MDFRDAVVDFAEAAFTLGWIQDLYPIDAGAKDMAERRFRSEMIAPAEDGPQIPRSVGLLSSSCIIKSCDDKSAQTFKSLGSVTHHICHGGNEASSRSGRPV